MSSRGPIHTCVVCHRSAPWDDSWEWYATHDDLFVKVCSKECKGRSVAASYISVRDRAQEKVDAWMAQNEHLADKTPAELLVLFLARHPGAIRAREVR